jgi:protein-S-isoprenylcysteine O-methyltransferase Ste14
MHSIDVPGILAAVRPASAFGWFSLAATLVVGLCVLAVIAAVIIDFAEAGQERKSKRSRRSIVATGSMSAFFIVVYLLIRFRLGALGKIPLVPHIVVILLGLLLMLLGAFMNLRGRVDLGRNWANHIKVYDDHTLVTRGAYRFVRHPLYASLVWMGVGVGLVYLNWAAVAATLFIFLPFMVYRARQEEELLAKEFKEYADYKKRTGMLFPRLWSGKSGGRP